MKVAVKFVVDVDVNEWRKEYGTDETPAEIRESIWYGCKSAVADAYRHQSDFIEVDPLD
jgi:hypothetical protein